MRLTVGPLPPAVYWRRRAIVLGAALLVLFLVAQACMSASASRGDPTAGDGPPTGTPTASPATGPATPDPTGSPTAAAPSPTPDGPEATGGPEQDGPGPQSPTPADPDVCTDEEMRITAEADHESIAAGDSVQFTIVIQNGSDRTCRRDVGAGQRELYLRQRTAAVKLWSSRDCVDLTGEEVRELPPGFESEHWTVWHGRASDRCENEAPAGGPVSPGEYELVARLGSAHSEPVTITMS